MCACNTAYFGKAFEYSLEKELCQMQPCALAMRVSATSHGARQAHNRASGIGNAQAARSSTFTTIQVLVLEIGRHSCTSTTSPVVSGLSVWACTFFDWTMYFP